MSCGNVLRTLALIGVLRGLFAWGWVEYSSLPYVAYDCLSAINRHVLNRNDLVSPSLQLLKGEGAFAECFH